MAITPSQFVAMLKEIAESIEAEKDRLSELDGPIGDGDHGVSMSIGWSAVTDALAGLPPGADFARICSTAAKSFLNAVGASAGPLYATAFLRGGAALKGCGALDANAFVAFIGAASQGIRDRGKASPGDKTMLDAWLPAVAAAEAAQASGASLAGCAAAAARAARDGAAATAGMLARMGRASRLGERSLGHVDPGAASTALIFEAMARGVARAEEST